MDNVQPLLKAFLLMNHMHSTHFVTALNTGAQCLSEGFIIAAAAGSGMQGEGRILCFPE